MSAPIYFVDSTVVIPPQNISEFLEAANEFNYGTTWETIDEYCYDDDWLYLVRDDGGYMIVYTDGDHYHSEERFWSKVAPYVEDGGFLEFNDDFGHPFRWKFVGGKLREIWAHIIVEWPE